MLKTEPPMPLSPNAQLVTDAFEEVARGNNAPWLEALHDSAVYRTIGTGSWSGTVKGKANILNDIFRPLSRRLASRQTVATRVIDALWCRRLARTSRAQVSPTTTTTGS
jgi:ketosteroid isomerase-like protein